MRILLVDDDVDDQVYFKDAVNELCDTLRCEIASNGLEALDRIDVPPPPDLIFLDLNMPVMNGFECLASLKKEDRYKNIPVIIFTTSKNNQDIDQARQMGADLFLPNQQVSKYFAPNWIKYWKWISSRCSSFVRSNNHPIIWRLVFPNDPGPPFCKLGLSLFFSRPPTQ